MSEVYRVVSGVLRTPRDLKSKRAFSTSSDYIKQGELVPEGLLDAQSIKSLLSAGRIAIANPEDVKAVVTRRGKWGVDPVGLVGKSHEELLVMVLEIDPDFDVSSLETEADAVRRLTADWDPAFREEIARATDRSRPEQLRHSGVKEGQTKPLSDIAQKALANAREKAQG